MQELIAAIKALEASSMNTIFDGVPHPEEGYCQDQLSPLVQQVVYEADGALITPKGQCDSRAIAELGRAGWRVTCGERDSFGWLSGVIHTSKGQIIYG